MDHSKQQSKKNADENGFLAALSYVSFLFIIPLFLKRRNTFVQSHAKQGLVIFIAEIILFFLILKIKFFKSPKSALVLVIIQIFILKI